MDFSEHLAQEVERTGHSIERGESSFTVKPINLKIESEIGERNEHHLNGQHSVVVEVSIKATHEMFPDGIWDCLAGFGGNDDEACSYAAQVWTSGVFLTIHEILVPTETKDFQIQRLDMITRADDTGEEFTWKIYLGALQAAGEFSNRTDLENTILVKKLFNAIMSVLYEKKLVWIKVFISKNKLLATEIQGDCWLNNQDWIEGLNALYWFAEEWEDVKSYAALKQFIIIKPCEISELENPEKIRQSLPPQKKSGFSK